MLCFIKITNCLIIENHCEDKNSTNSSALMSLDSKMRLIFGSKRELLLHVLSCEKSNFFLPGVAGDELVGESW